MSIFALVVLSFGLATDAFAVALVQGVRMRAIRPTHVLAVAGSFGLFQGVMPLIGWLIGAQFGHFIVSFDHWIAFGLLALIGMKMLKDAIWPAADDESKITGVDDGVHKLDVRGLLLLSVATSIDALAVGITLALIDVSIVWASTVIAIVTFVLSVFGVLLGHRFGARFRRIAELIGGVVLIGIGMQILLEHLLG